MKAFSELPHQGLADQELMLKQPSALKSEYVILADNELVGTMRWPKALSSLCNAETADGSWTFERHGWFGTRVIARVSGSQEDVLVYQSNWSGMKGTIAHVDGREFGLKASSMWGDRFELVQKRASGEEIELLNVKINFHLLRESANVAIRPTLAQTKDSTLLAMFGCYLALMAYEEMASGSGD